MPNIIIKKNGQEVREDIEEETDAFGEDDLYLKRPEDDDLYLTRPEDELQVRQVTDKESLQKNK